MTPELDPVFVDALRTLCSLITLDTRMHISVFSSSARIPGLEHVKEPPDKVWYFGIADHVLCRIDGARDKDEARSVEDKVRHWADAYMER